MQNPLSGTSTGGLAPTVSARDARGQPQQVSMSPGRIPSRALLRIGRRTQDASRCRNGSVYRPRSSLNTLAPRPQGVVLEAVAWCLSLGARFFSMGTTSRGARSFRRSLVGSITVGSSGFQYRPFGRNLRHRAATRQWV